METETTLSTEGAARNAAKSLARYVLTAERILMGVILIGCGLSGLLNLLPHASTEGAAQLGGTLLKAGFMYPLLKGTEVLLQVYVDKLRG